MDIGQMPAGPEMDALIDEKIFGEKRLSQAEMRAEAERVWNTEGYREIFTDFRVRGGIKNPEFYQEGLPYSTSIASAWIVVETLRNYNWKLTDEIRFTIFKDATHYDGVADTVPLAICRAALLSTGKL